MGQCEGVPFEKAVSTARSVLAPVLRHWPWTVLLRSARWPPATAQLPAAVEKVKATPFIKIDDSLRFVVRKPRNDELEVFHLEVF